MAKEVISRCDVCGTSEDVEEFEIKRQGAARTVDLCTSDRAPLVELYELGSEPRKAPVRRGPQSNHAVVAIEDWDPSLVEPASVQADAGTRTAEERAAEEREADLVEAVRPFIGTAQLSAKVDDALTRLVRAVEGEGDVSAARRLVADLSPRRIKVPSSTEGERLRGALVDYQKAFEA